MSEGKTQLIWTSDRPVVSGWYWGRHPLILDLVMVWVGQEAIARNEFKPGSQWSGPIPEPVEPAGLPIPDTGDGVTS